MRMSDWSSDVCSSDLAEAALLVPPHQAVRLEGHGQAVRRGAGQAGAIDQLSEARRAHLHGGEHDHRLVEHADSAYTVHEARLSSHRVRHKDPNGQDSLGEGVGPPRGAPRTRRPPPPLPRPPPPPHVYHPPRPPPPP